MDGMESLLNASGRRSGALGWAVLLPVVILVCMVYWGVRPWTWTVVLAAGAIALLAPAVAADLLPVTLIVLACVAFGLTRRDVALPQGSGTTDGYPLHALVFGDGLPHVVDLSMGVVLLAFGVWLVPRTIGAHSALAKRNSELVSRVRRLSGDPGGRGGYRGGRTAAGGTRSARRGSGPPGRAGHVVARDRTADPD